MAEYERAKIIERHRRGKLHAARLGSVNGLSGAPSGYRYVTQHAGGGQARSALMPEEAGVVRQVLAWLGRDRLAIGEVCRRLMQAGARTRTGRLGWERSGVWARLKNPTYMGSAAFGKPRQGPLRPTLRALRGRPLPPRRAVSDYEMSPADWRHLPVPAIVAPEGCAAVQEHTQIKDATVLRPQLSRIRPTPGFLGLSRYKAALIAFTPHRLPHLLVESLLKGPFPRRHNPLVDLAIHGIVDIAREGRSVHNLHIVSKVASVMKLRCMTHRDILS